MYDVDVRIRIRKGLQCGTLQISIRFLATLVSFVVTDEEFHPLTVPPD